MSETPEPAADGRPIADEIASLYDQRDQAILPIVAETTRLKKEHAKVIQEMHLLNIDLKKVRFDEPRRNALKTRLVDLKMQMQQLLMQKADQKLRMTEVSTHWERLIRQANGFSMEKLAEIRSQRAKRRYSSLDEFDLNNALMEPQGLLQRCHAQITKLTKMNGVTPECRGLLESLEDYFRRHAMQV